MSQRGPLGAVVGHSVLAMITSAMHSSWSLEVPVGDLAAPGLPAPSVVRMKLFTLDDQPRRPAGRVSTKKSSRVAATTPAAPRAIIRTGTLVSRSAAPTRTLGLRFVASMASLLFPVDRRRPQTSA
jgi:hypothetical protein